MSASTRDAALAIVVVAAFAALVTVHVATLFGLARRKHFREALGALILPPLAPYWACTRGMRARGIAWFVTATLYGVAFVLAR